MRAQASARRLLLGADGPEVRTSAVVAALVGPAARQWLQVLRANVSDEALVELEGWVSAMEAAGAAYQRSVSDIGAVDGQLHRGARDPVDAQAVTGIPTSVAAERLHVSERTVTRLLAEHQLTGTQVGKTWLVDPASVDAFQARAGAA